MIIGRFAAAGLFHGLVVIGAMEHHFAAVVLDGVQLHDGRLHRHADLGADAAFRRVIRHGLPVIARRCGNHAVRALLRRQCQDAVQRAALFERPGHLQVFHLQAQRVTGRA